MSRVRLACLLIAVGVAGCFVLPPAASAAGHDNPAAACTKDTHEVTNLTAVVTKLGIAFQAIPPDATKLSQVSGDLFNAVVAAQSADCLPPLPTSPTTQAPQPATQPEDTTKCAADAVQVLSAALGVISAATANPPDPAAVQAATQKLADAIKALNADSCLPVALPVPTGVPTSRVTHIS
jgi:hypothetical protein